ncbi:hypothetical protein [Undibacterium macrobrachii]|jgi:hypothetical protein|uniref:Lipoprotein n=1 Tax=Undibacterium macrobrachii TaxID=1119058 RepID=A0ABQ2XNS7_9BURK|nr:hypothetical protein [Undibacterium macrobrachii]GGX26744.1 hypothetical protein GCM10011282_35910 [Undibacterium macrobrachii]
MARFNLRISLRNFAYLGPLTLLALSACGGGGSPSSTTNNGAVQATSSFVCSGTVKELFTAAQGTYDGTVDPAFLPGAGAPLSVGAVYPVSISGQDCSIRFTGARDIKYVFAFGDTNNTVPSNFVGFSATKILQNPNELDLKNVQYNISISTSNNIIELERRIAKNSAGTGSVDGDLHLYSIPGDNSFGGMHLKVASKRSLN